MYGGGPYAEEGPPAPRLQAPDVRGWTLTLHSQGKKAASRPYCGPKGCGEKRQVNRLVRQQGKQALRTEGLR